MYNCIINIKKKFDISYFDIGKHSFFFLYTDCSISLHRQICKENCSSNCRIPLEFCNIKGSCSSVCQEEWILKAYNASRDNYHRLLLSMWTYKM